LGFWEVQGTAQGEERQEDQEAAEPLGQAHLGGMGWAVDAEILVGAMPMEGMDVGEAAGKGVEPCKAKGRDTRTVKEVGDKKEDKVAKVAFEARMGISAQGSSADHKGLFREAAVLASTRRKVWKEEVEVAVGDGQQDTLAGRLDDRHREGGLDDDRRRHCRCVGDRRPIWKRGLDCPSSFRFDDTAGVFQCRKCREWACEHGDLSGSGKRAESCRQGGEKGQRKFPVQVVVEKPPRQDMLDCRAADLWVVEMQNLFQPARRLRNVRFAFRIARCVDYNFVRQKTE